MRFTFVRLGHGVSASSGIANVGVVVIQVDALLLKELINVLLGRVEDETIRGALHGGEKANQLFTLILTANAQLRQDKIK